MISRFDSAAMVPKTSEDLPEPETPVKTVRRRLGMSTETDARLFSRAPLTSIMSWLSATVRVGCCMRTLRAIVGRVNPARLLVLGLAGSIISLTRTLKLGRQYGVVSGGSGRKSLKQRVSGTADAVADRRLWARSGARVARPSVPDPAG